MATIPRTASPTIKAVPSANRSSIGLSPLLLVAVAVDLKSGGAQSWHAIPVQVPLPGEKLIDRDAVHLDRFLDRDPAAAYGSDDHRFACHRPSLAWTGQLRNKIQQVDRVRSHTGHRPRPRRSCGLLGTF